MARSRLPAIPTLPSTLDPQLRTAFHAMREVVLALLGVRGDPRDAAPTAEELSSLYTRIFSLERELATAAYDAARTADLSVGGANDRVRFSGFVYDAADVVGAIDFAGDDDSPVFSGTILVSGTIAATSGNDAPAFSGTVT